MDFESMILDDINYIMEELKVVHKLHMKLMSQCCEGITGDQARLLFLIKKNKTNQKEIAHSLNITEATLSVRIKRLVELGLIEREVDSQDKRNYTIVLSKQGENTLGDIERTVAFSQEVICKGITKSEYDTIINVIKKIQNNLKEEIEC
ncbi:MAG: MarR family transcriptional regulator [Coprobacillus sp.]